MATSFKIVLIKYRIGKNLKKIIFSIYNYKMFKLTYNITINQQCLKQILFINEKMVIISLNNKWSVFHKEMDSSYYLNMDNKSLSVIDYSKFKFQMESISKEFGAIEMCEKKSEEILLGYPSKKYHYKNAQIVPNLNSEIKVVAIPQFDKTAYISYINFEKKNQLIEIPLESNELIAYNITDLIFLQGKQTQKTELILIEEWSFSNDFLEISNYSLRN